MGFNEAFLQSDVSSQLSLACQLVAASGLLQRSDAASLDGSTVDLNASLDSTALADLTDVESNLEETDSDPITKPEVLEDPALLSVQLAVPRPLSVSSNTDSVSPSIASNVLSSYWPWQQSEDTQCRVPVVFTVNLLCSSFLLDGRPGVLIDDRRVRVSVKSLALACVGAAVDLLPSVLQGQVYNLSSSTATPGDPQLLRDVLLFSRHSDQQLRGNTFLIVGYLIQSALVLGRSVSI